MARYIKGLSKDKRETSISLAPSAIPQTKNIKITGRQDSEQRISKAYYDLVSSFNEYALGSVDSSRISTQQRPEDNMLAEIERAVDSSKDQLMRIGFGSRILRPSSSKD